MVSDGPCQWESSGVAIRSRYGATEGVRCRRIQIVHLHTIIKFFRKYFLNYINKEESIGTAGFDVSASVSVEEDGGDVGMLNP